MAILILLHMGTEITNKFKKLDQRGISIFVKLKANNVAFWVGKRSRSNSCAIDDG